MLATGYRNLFAREKPQILLRAKTPEHRGEFWLRSRLDRGCEAPQKVTKPNGLAARA